MDASQPIRSPARRAKRCMIFLFVCLIAMVGGYTVLRAARFPIEKTGPIVTAYDATSGRSRAPVAAESRTNGE